MAIDNELKQIWKEFAQKTKGKFEYDESVFPLGDRFKCKIDYDFDGFSVHFIAYQHRTATDYAPKIYTKVFVPLDKEFSLGFSLYPENIANRILKVVGFQDIIIGIPELDKKFIFKGNDPNTIKKIFSNEQITKLLLTNYDYNLKIKKGKNLLEIELPSKTDFLFSESDQLIKDTQLLENLLALFVEVMNKLKK